MVNLKSADRSSQATPTQKRRNFSLKQLSWFIFASLLVHGLGLFFVVKYRIVQPLNQEPIEQKPIEFVVVPEESEVEPPPETNNRAAENSVAEPELESAETTADNPSSPEPVSESEPIAQPEPVAPPPAPAPEPEPIAQPEPIAPPPEPEPEPVAQPEPITPPPALEPEPIAQPEPPETTTPTIDNQTPILSNSNNNSTPIPQTETPETTSPITSSSPSESESPPEAQPPEKTAALPQPTEDSAASLLGGSYQKTLANGGDAFFSPEALEYKSVLNPAQLSALKDIDLSDYIAAMERRVKPNWNPNYRVDDRSTVLTFDIQKNGQVTGLRITRSSGLADVDRASLEAIQRSSPFPPLPPGFPLESLEITFSFNIHIY
ncbi:MAG: TonB family protein [Cyanobacteria bacterium P01_G01_bin.67]